MIQTNKEKELAEAIVEGNDLDITVDEGVETIENITDAIIDGTKRPISRMIKYKDPVIGKVKDLEIWVKIVPNNAMQGIRNRLKKQKRLDLIQNEVVKKYWVNKDGVQFSEVMVDQIPSGLIDKIFEAIKDVSNIDDSKDKQLFARESIKNS